MLLVLQIEKLTIRYGHTARVDLKTQYVRDCELFIQQKHRGAVEARRAHNPDVVGSKPTGANFFIFLQCSWHFTTYGGRARGINSHLFGFRNGALLSNTERAFDFFCS